MAIFMASKYAKECWENGTRLCAAWRDFAPAELKEAITELPGILEASLEKLEEGRLASLLPAFNAGNSVFLERDRLEREMRDQLLTAIYNEDLIAVGYREAPSRSQSPIMIDPEHFNFHDPDWKTETLEVHGIRYGQIRIFDPYQAPPIARAKDLRGSKPAIEEAIDQLIKMDPQFGNSARKIDCQKIRDYLGIAERKGNGLSDQNLSKAIVRKLGKRGISPNYN